MNIAVIGAGIIGVTTAYELARDGHQVTVYERRGAVAEEASFANAGVLSPGYVTPWAAPGMPAKVLKQMLQPHAAFRLKLPLSMQELAWLWQFWRACEPQTYLAHRSALQQLALFSRTQLHEIIVRHEMEFDYERGYLIALRSDKERALLAPSLQVLRDLGMPFAELDEAGARTVEPAINADTRFSGAIHLADDEVANCRQFALLLKDECRKLGVIFEFNADVEKIQLFNAAMSSLVSSPVSPLVGKESSSVATLSIAETASDSQLPGLSGVSGLPHSQFKTTQRNIARYNQQHDAVVLCTGMQSRRLLAPLGIALPLVPVYGYSVSCQIKEPLDAPRSGLMDERYKVSITRLGQRVRVAGSAQVGGKANAMHMGALKTLYKVLQDWFPGAAIMSKGVQQWQGARPMLANRPPVIGRGGQDGLWLNLGHGSSGWALSCGSARLLADQMGGREGGLDSAQFALSRSLR
jgi:D-amino-acid dehydrogenase